MVVAKIYQNVLSNPQKASSAVRALSLFGFLVAFITVAIILRVLYNLFVHPLRSFPGPLLARASILPYQQVALDGRLPKWIHELHQRYGPVIRYGPNELSFIEPQTWKDAFGHKSASFKKDANFYGPDQFGGPPGLIRADNESHARQRRLVSHAFSHKALQDQEPLLKGYVGLLILKLKEASEGNYGGKVDMVDYYNFTAFDIMADLTFGEPLKLLEGSSYDPWVRALFDNLKIIQLNQLIRAWPGLSRLSRALVPKSAMEKRRLHQMHTIERVEKRLARKTDRPDIWTHILRYSNSEENKDRGLLPNEMISNAGLFMTAGTETTATVLSGLTYYLLKDPQRLQRLKKEIRDAFATYENITMPRLAELGYLRACIDEGLRIYPPVSGFMNRVAPKGGTNVAGYWVPQGTVVNIPHYAAYHSASNFKDPDEFVPERWLPEGQEDYGLDRKSVLQPFSYGPRNCLGMNLAYHEMRLVLASVLWHFDVEFCEESEGWPNQLVWILWKKGPLMVKLKSIRS
ncbi:cytochrome P450 [Amniculicola lignicola CBS 123094]|uniref:Cytochrome P450 n=1 Tax=Amniculicola lignicola CBS 123094 TaxID=1392246 RepID=A0A6A5WKA9_9PLEO|nr:cytochrome P450 [Amniculicola lignicola CBS 123094]